MSLLSYYAVWRHKSRQSPSENIRWEQLPLSLNRTVYTRITEINGHHVQNATVDVLNFKQTVRNEYLQQRGVHCQISWVHVNIQVYINPCDVTPFTLWCTVTLRCDCAVCLGLLQLATLSISKPPMSLNTSARRSRWCHYPVGLF